MTDSTSDSERSEALLGEALDLVTGLWSGQLLHTAVGLGMVDLLADGPTTADDVAGELDLDADSTYRLLRALGHYGAVTEGAQRRFSLTPVGECYTADHPCSVRTDLRFARSPEFISAMLHLPAIVREGGRNGFVREFGCGIYEYAENNPAFGQAVSEFMTAKPRRHTDEVLNALDSAGFEQDSHVCDVGGGRGHLLARLLERYPHLEGTVLDLPGVVAQTDRHEVVTFGVENRCNYVAGDMFEDVPTADAYLLKTVLHNWEDEECVEILTRIHEAAPPDAHVFVVEAVVPGPGTDHFAKRLDMTMLVHTGGRERTEDEYGTLFQRAGWKHVETYDPSAGPASVLEATKV